MTRVIAFSWILVFLGSVVTASAQPRQPNREGISAKGQVNSGFERSAPALGELLPDVTGYDADGNEFKLSSLKGQYSVLVFGCLT